MQEIKPLKKLKLSQIHAQKEQQQMLLKRAPVKVLDQKMTQEHQIYLKQLQQLKDSKTEVRKQCPYSSSIKRHLLDFDYEKFCSVSLSKQNVYCCLVCGKYFEGRSQDSYAYFHSLEHDHHLFMNLDTAKVYCLPEDYEFDHPMLANIKVSSFILTKAKFVPKFFRGANSSAEGQHKVPEIS